MPLITTYQSTTIARAFVLNSLVAALTIVVALNIKSWMDHWGSRKEPGPDNPVMSWRSTLLTASGAFLASWLVYWGMHFLFGYGGGMLASST